MPRLVWIALALLAGVAVGVLPPLVSGALIALAIIGVLCAVDLRIALLVLLTIAPLKALIETELPGAIGLPLDVGQATFVIVFGLWLARTIAARPKATEDQPNLLQWAWSPIYVPLLVFIGCAAFSLITSLSVAHTLKELAIWGGMLVMAILLVALCRAYGFGGIVAAILLAAVIQSGIGLYEFLGGSGAPHLWILDFRYFRAFGSFGQPNPFGAYMGLMLPLALGVAYGTGGEAWRVYRAKQKGDLSAQDNTQLWQWVLFTTLALAAAGILGVGLVISWSRGAWVGFALAALALLFFAPKRGIVGLALAGVVFGGAILGVVTGLAPQSLVARFSDFTQDLTGFGDVRGQVISDANYAVLERFAHWQAALNMASDSPVFGIGFGAYEVGYPLYPLMNWKYALGHAHNYYLNLLAETGLVGLSGYLFAWAFILTFTVRTLRCLMGWQRGLALGLLGVWVHLLGHSLFDKLYVNNLFLHIGALLGVIGALSAMCLGMSSKIGNKISTEL